MKDIAEYLTDSFIDYKGQRHIITACALSQSPKSNEYNLMVGWADEDDYLDKDDSIYDNVHRMVSIGIAICNPTDVHDIEIGKKVAYNKASADKPQSRIYSTGPGLIGEGVVKALLRQEVDFIKKHPEKIIKGYEEAKKRYYERESIKTSYLGLNESEKNIVHEALNGSDLSFYQSLAYKLIDKNIKVEEL